MPRATQNGGIGNRIAKLTAKRPMVFAGVFSVGSWTGRCRLQIAHKCPKVPSVVAVVATFTIAVLRHRQLALGWRGVENLANVRAVAVASAGAGPSDRSCSPIRGSSAVGRVSEKAPVDVL